MPARTTLALALLLTLAAGCGPSEQQAALKSDAELGLDPQQARGRKLYDLHCGTCHHAYTSSDLNGPSMSGLFRKPYMPSGTPANDDRVSDVILMGRAKMPAYRSRLTPQDLRDLLAYLRTL